MQSLVNLKYYKATSLPSILQEDKKEEYQSFEVHCMSHSNGSKKSWSRSVRLYDFSSEAWLRFTMPLMPGNST